jgi:hypothetical protein
MNNKNIKRALIVAVVVGSLLNTINSYDVFWNGNFTTLALSHDAKTIYFAFSERSEKKPAFSSPQRKSFHVYAMSADGSNLRRATPEAGQFVAWSPDRRYLLISGRALYVIRPDGTGRLELRAEGIDRPLGGIPDWH